MFEDQYHAEWKTGKWITNCSNGPSDFESRYIHGTSDLGSIDPDVEYMMGPPHSPQNAMTVEALLKMGSVGAYVRPKNPKLSIAERIRGGETAAYGWGLDLDTTRVDGTELKIVLANIADCVANGVTQGMCPYWKLEMTQ